MASETTIIDLGLIPRDHPQAEPALPTRPRPWVGRGTWWAAGAVTALVVLMNTASAPEPAAWLVPHFTVLAGSDGQFTVTENTLHVYQQGPSGGVALTAYRLGDGAEVWRAEADDAYSWLGVPQLISYDGPGPVRTTVLDPDTGEMRWSGEGYVEVLGSRLLIQDQPSFGGGGPDSSLTVLNWRSGDEVWTLPSVRDWVAVAPRPGRPARLATTDGEGRLAVYELETGALLATGSGPPLPEDTYLFIAGDIVYAQTFGGDSASINAYEMTTLEHRWSLGARTNLWQVTPCGQVLCVNLGGRPGVLDHATGELAWSVDWDQVDFSSILDLGPRWPGYLVMAGDENPERPGRLPGWLVDAETGAPVLNLGDWRPHLSGDPGLAADTPHPILTQYEVSRTPVVEQLGPSRQRILLGEDGRTWFARLHLDRDPPRIEVLGTADSGSYGCRLGAGYLACEDRDEINVWRVR
jgi:hypothetical protein